MKSKTRKGKWSETNVAKEENTMARKKLSFFFTWLVWRENKWFWIFGTIFNLKYFLSVLSFDLAKDSKTQSQFVFVRVGL